MLLLDPFHCTMCGDELATEERLKHTGLCRGCEWIEALQAQEKDAVRGGHTKKAVCKKEGG